MRSKKAGRRGLSVPEWFCILGFGAIGLFAFGSLTGESARDAIDNRVNAPTGILGMQGAAARAQSGSTSSDSGNASSGSSGASNSGNANSGSNAGGGGHE